jgi:hypothetical protein
MQLRPESTDPYGRTPLLWAAENGHEVVVKLLFYAVIGIERAILKNRNRDMDSHTSKITFSFLFTIGHFYFSPLSLLFLPPHLLFLPPYQVTLYLVVALTKLTGYIP